LTVLASDLISKLIIRKRKIINTEKRTEFLIIKSKK